MKIKEFTEEEQLILRGSEYVVDVTSRFVYFSAAFKEQFYKEYQAGKKPRQIVREFGIDPDLIGQSRINGLKQHIMITPCKPGRALRSLLSVALSSLPVKHPHYTIGNPFFTPAPLKLSLTWGTLYFRLNPGMRKA